MRHRNALIGSTFLALSALGSMSAEAKAVGPRYEVAVYTVGDGAGSVESNAGIDCGFNSVCRTTVPAGARVELTAQSHPGSRFEGWTGACTGVGVCQITMDQMHNLTARFTRERRSAAPYGTDPRIGRDTADTDGILIASAGGISESGARGGLISMLLALGLFVRVAGRRSS